MNKINRKKNAVVTLCIGNKAERISKLTHPIMKEYVNKINVDFIVLNKIKITKLKRFKDYPFHFEKFQIYDLLDKYNRIIFFDMDIIVKPDCPNLFEIVPECKFGAFLESDIESRDNEIREFQKKVGNIMWKKDYFNSGVMIFSKKQKEVFNYNKKLYRDSTLFAGGDQSQINYNIHKLKIPLFNIGLKFNHIIGLRKEKGKIFKDRFNSYIIHYAGSEYFSEDRYSLINDDLKIIREGKQYMI